MLHETIVTALIALAAVLLLSYALAIAVNDLFDRAEQVVARWARFRRFWHRLMNRSL